MDCIFCKILKKEIPAQLVYQDEFVIAFKDIAPLAKQHVLFIHKDHTVNLNDMMEKNSSAIGEVFSAIAKYTASNQLNSAGYRVVTNVGTLAGQSVFHTHFHLLAGEKLGPFGA